MCSGKAVVIPKYGSCAGEMKYDKAGCSGFFPAGGPFTQHCLQFLKDKFDLVICHVAACRD